MKKNKILIHSIAFSPDGVSTAYLYNDIALGFKEHGYDVVVLTTTPHYNAISSELKKQPMKKKWGGLYYLSFFNGIPVYHVPQKKFKSSIARVAGFVYWHILSILLGLSQKNLALIIAPSPPLTIGLVSVILAKIKKAKVVYNVQEIYPDLLINHGSLKPGFIINLLSRLEKFIYDHCDMVTTIDEVFYRTIVSRFKDPAKLAIIPNFVDTDVYSLGNVHLFGLDKDIFPDRPVLKLMYAGNVGHAQDWEPVLFLAKALRAEPVEFWIIGEGVLKDELKKKVENEQLTNIHVLPYQPRLQMAAIIDFADVHFIFMNPQVEGQGFPSKVYTIMACKKPLLVLTGLGTPLYQFLKDKDCAFLVSDPEPEIRYKKTEAIIRNISTDRSSIGRLGQNGYEVVQSTYSKKIVTEQYTRLVTDLLQ